MSNSNTNLQTQSSNALHNAIMEAGSKDRPPMLAPGNYVQWKSRIKRYIDTKPNRELIHYSLQNPPYIYQWAEKTVPVAEGSSETTIERYMENYKNVSQDIRDQMNAEAEAVQIILTGIDNDIYSTVDACPRSMSMSSSYFNYNQNGKALLIIPELLTLLLKMRSMSKGKGDDNSSLALKYGRGENVGTLHRAKVWDSLVYNCKESCNNNLIGIMMIADDDSKTQELKHIILNMAQLNAGLSPHSFDTSGPILLMMTNA
ncbi:hypothetical protein Tco_1146829 [Tanacetum coccineum]